MRDEIVFVGLILVVLLFGGEPDLMDAVIHWIVTEGCR